MTEEKLKELLTAYRGEEVAFKSYRSGNYIYIVGVRDYDDREAKAGGSGFVRFNTDTMSFEEIHYLQIPSEIYDDDSQPTRNSIANGIVQRQYVNEKDMLDFTEMIYEGNDEDSFNFGKIFYNYKRDKEKIRAHFRSTEIRDAFKTFLESVCVRCVIDNEGWLEFDRVPVQNAAE